MNYWKLLGINQTTDKKSVKRAYAKLLKQHKPEQDPEGYQRLREAFDMAIKYCNTANQSTPNSQKVIKESAESDFFSPNQDFVSDGELSAAEIEKKLSQSTEYAEERIQQQQAKKEQLEASRLQVKQEREQGDETRKKEFENQRKQQIEKQQKQLHFIELIEAGHRQIFSCDDTEEAIKVFSSQLNNDVLQLIRYRQLFEQLCFRTGVEWDRPRKFPSELFEHIADTFDWGRLDSNDPYFVQNIGYLRGRIHVGLEYLALVKLSQKNTFLRKYSHEISAARLILGKFRPYYFRWEAFFNHHHEQITGIIEKFTNTYPIELCPEIDTESFRWWQIQRQKHRYSISHFVLGILLAIIPVFAILSGNDLYLGPGTLVATIGVSSIILSVLGWFIIQCVLRGWKSLKHFYTGRWQTWIKNPYLYSSLTVLYILLFLSKNFIENGMTNLFLYIAGYLLVFLLVGARIVLIFIATMASVTVELVAYVIDPPKTPDNISILIGIASHFCWMALIRRFQSGFFKKINDNFFLVVTLHVIISAGMGFALLTSLKYIQ